MCHLSHYLVSKCGLSSFVKYQANFIFIMFIFFNSKSRILKHRFVYRHMCFLNWVVTRILKKIDTDVGIISLLGKYIKKSRLENNAPDCYSLKTTQKTTKFMTKLCTKDRTTGMLQVQVHIIFMNGPTIILPRVQTEPLETSFSFSHPIKVFFRGSSAS